MVLYVHVMRTFFNARIKNVISRSDIDSCCVSVSESTNSSLSLGESTIAVLKVAELLVLMLESNKI